MKWLPPVSGLKRIHSWFDKSKGRLVRVEIYDEPETLDTLIEWTNERRSMGYETEIRRCYLRGANQYGYAVKLSPDHPYVYIADDLTVYVKQKDYVKNHAALRVALRYILTYAGYKLKYRRTDIDTHKNVRTTQITLTEKLSKEMI